MTTYVRAAKHSTDDPNDHRTRVTGDVLHLSVWVPDAPGTTLLYGAGRDMPICGGIGSNVELWRWTGPAHHDWHGHAHWPLCRRCVRALDRLVDALNDQELRAAAHEAAS